MTMSDLTRNVLWQKWHRMQEMKLARMEQIRGRPFDETELLELHVEVDPLPSPFSKFEDMPRFERLPQRPLEPRPPSWSRERKEIIARKRTGQIVVDFTVYAIAA